MERQEGVCWNGGSSPETMAVLGTVVSSDRDGPRVGSSPRCRNQSNTAGACQSTCALRCQGRMVDGRPWRWQERDELVVWRRGGA